MLDPLSGKRLVVGVCGGIAAYKAVLLVRLLRQRGVQVQVVCTPSALRFVGEATWAALSQRPVYSDFWSAPGTSQGELHVELGAWADGMVVAPATMQVLASAAAGLADSLLLATLACCGGPRWLVPAMHTRMWLQPVTQRNVAQLRADGWHFVGPVDGALASGEQGIGRMSEPQDVAAALTEFWQGSLDLRGRRVLITAGPTCEDLDPVRFLGNRSSGRMGYALAQRAVERGAAVTLISGPVEQPPPPGLAGLRQVRSALQMQAAVQAALPAHEALIMAAAVSDQRPAAYAEGKLKKADAASTLELVANPDILAELGSARRDASPLLVGFALETENVAANARRKLQRKQLDLVVGNEASTAFAGDSNRAVLIDRDHTEELPTMSKMQLADRILDRLAALLRAAAPSFDASEQAR